MKNGQLQDALKGLLPLDFSSLPTELLKKADTGGSGTSFGSYVEKFLCEDLDLPAWFWFEYFFVFRRVSDPAPDDFEKLKYGQDLASKIWLAVVSALLMLYFGKDLRH